jgi:hypothetical protein
VTDDELIASYFWIDWKIKECKRRIAEKRAIFYSQTMSSHVTSDETRIFSEGFNVEYNVTQLVDTLAVTEESMKVLEFKHKHFRRYLRELSESDRRLLIDKYKNGSQATNGRIESACLEEIREIETAAVYRFKLEIPLFESSDAEDADPMEIEQIDAWRLEAHFDQMMNELMGAR